MTAVLCKDVHDVAMVSAMSSLCVMAVNIRWMAK
jgi:hypothetical protein